MDRFKETELSSSSPSFQKAKKATSNMGPPTVQPRRNTSDDVVMREPTLKVSFVGGPMPPSGRFSKKSSSGIGDLNTERSSSSARQQGNTFPQMRKKTSMATKSVSPLLVTAKSVNTPRVRFAQQKSTTTPRPSLINVTPAQNTSPSFSFPARKVGSSPLFRNQQPQQATTSLQPTPFSVKIARPFLPLWQQLDEEYQRGKRKRDVRRISSAHQSRQHVGQKIDPTRKKGCIAPKLHLRLDGETVISSGEDEDHEPRRQPPIKIPIKLAGGRQIAVKKSAARKIEFVDTTSDEVSEGDFTMDNDSQEDQLLPEEYDLPQRLDGEQGTLLRPSTVFNPAPQITIALPQVKAEPEDDPPVGGLGPPEELVNAVEALTISPIRMQATRRLPFLRRNLRQGFIRRCADVLIPIHSDQKHVSLEVSYEYVDGIVFQAEIEDWLCPLCNLFGKFTTQATLFCHLKWDHQEIFSEWEKIEESDVRQKWKLQVVIPQEVCDDGQVRHPHLQNETDDANEQDEEEKEEEGVEVSDEHIHRSPSIPASTFSSPFPSVSLSPVSPRQESQTDQKITTPPDIPSSSKIKFSREETPLPSISRSISIHQPSSSRSRSMTGTSQNTMATMITATPRIPAGGRYPTPPPPDDPLGPAARPPYLPAYSEYGGPTVYYSCKPGGACLFDLLGTLPMKEFGILDWEVLDREEEIYESDDVKEEYKVMHALWARWIMRHRNLFISNYHQGALAFVNYYWRMIHRAAGWNALRYWLLILLANQFLNSQQVAQILTHYEELTGMAFWCDSL